MKKERFTCKRGGLTINGYIFGKDDNKKPAVILSHGFLANQRMCYSYAKLLAKLGYVAFTFDFCGGGLFSSSDGKGVDMTLFTEKADLISVLNTVKALPFVDNSNISLLGYSQGGFVSALLAKQLKKEINRLILLYPAFSIVDDAKRGKMLFYKFDSTAIPDILGSFPMKLGGSYARTVINMDVIDKISGFTGPVLYLHGTRDKIVPLSYAVLAKDCYPNCSYYEIKNGGHMFRGRAEREARRLITDFMKSKLYL